MKSATGKFNIEKHKPIDKSDLAFRITGVRLRWIGAYQTEHNPGRIWTALRKDDLDASTIKTLEGHNPGIFSDGDTIRKGDLTLAYASEDAALAARKELDEEHKDAMSRIKTPQGNSPSMRVVEAELSRMGADQFKSRDKQGD